MTEKDLEEFEKEFGFKFLLTGFKKPLYRLRYKEYCILLNFKGNLGNKPINRYVSLVEVKKYGLFRNVPDNVSINEILANCEVIG